MILMVKKISPENENRKGNSAAFQFTAFLPESFENLSLKAGLLACSVSEAFPSQTVALGFQKLIKGAYSSGNCS